MKYNVLRNNNVVGVIDGIKLFTENEKLRQFWSEFEKNGVTIFGTVGKMPEGLKSDGELTLKLSAKSLNAAMMELQLEGYQFSEPY